MMLKDLGVSRDRTNHDNGAFAETITAKAALQFRIPEHLSFEDAATMGVALMTCV